MLNALEDQGKILSLLKSVEIVLDFTLAHYYSNYLSKDQGPSNCYLLSEIAENDLIDCTHFLVFEYFNLPIAVLL